MKLFYTTVCGMALLFWLFTGLVPLKLYSFRVGVSGTRGQMVYTDVITRVV